MPHIYGFEFDHFTKDFLVVPNEYFVHNKVQSNIDFIHFAYNNQCIASFAVNLLGNL